MKIKHLFVSILLVTGFQPMIAQSALRQQFVNSPVQEARPWTFWYWMFGAVTPEGITADLEAMHRVGLGGAYLMPIKGVEQVPQYEGKAQQLTPEWWRMVTHSMKEADRLEWNWECISVTALTWREVPGKHPKSRCIKWYGVIL